MSLYIRVQNSYWNHRKTAKLRSTMGDDALWIMPRLWSYASENQPDGDLSGYTSQEIAMLIGCPKYATSIKDNIINAGFIDSNGCLHDWEEHNGYHFNYSVRAKTAAKARWSKNKRKERKGKEISNASSMLVASIDKSIEDKDFCLFYEAYPRKIARQKAYQSWIKSKIKPDVGVIIRAIEVQKQSKDWTKDGGQYIPHPATWLNQGRWADEINSTVSKKLNNWVSS